MAVDLSTLKAGDKVMLRDGSKIVVWWRNNKLGVLTHYIDVWDNDGAWARKTNYPCDFDIICILKGIRP